MFNESVGIKYSNEAEILSIRKALAISILHEQGRLVIEGGLANAIKWALGLRHPPWK